MPAILSSVGAIILGMGIVQVGNGLLTTLLGLRMGMEGFPTEVVGLVMSCYFAGQIIGARLVPRVIERVGHIRTFAAAAALLAASGLGHVLVIFPIAWGVLRLVTGTCMAGLIMVSESWTNERATRKTRGKILAIYMITIYFAVGVGQPLLNAGDMGGFELFVLAGVLLTLGVLPVTLTAAAAPVVEERSRLKIRELWAVSPLGLTGVAGAGLVNSSFYGMGPIFAQGVGLDVAGISAFMGLTVFAGLLMQWSVGWISDRFDRRTVLTGVFFGVALASLAIVPAAETSHVALFAFVALYGGLSFTFYSISISHANDFIAPGDLVKASGGYLLIYGTGAVVGPFTASALMAWIGPAGLFVYAAAINLLLGAFALYRMTRRDARPKAEQGAFVALPATSAVFKGLDPRVDSESPAGAEPPENENSPPPA